MLSKCRESWFVLVACALVAGAALPLDAAEEKSGHAKAAKQGEHDHDKSGTHDESGEHEEQGDHAHAHLGAAGMSEPGLINVRTDLAVYTVIVFLILLAVLWKFAWKPIREGLDNREKHIQEQISAAEKANEDAKAMMADYEQKLLASQDEVRAIIEEARRDAEHTRQEMVAKVEEEVQTMRDRAQRDVETAKSQAIKELAQWSTDLAVSLTSKLVGTSLSKEDHAKLIDEQIGEAVSKYEDYSQN